MKKNLNRLLLSAVTIVLTVTAIYFIQSKFFPGVNASIIPYQQQYIANNCSLIFDIPEEIKVVELPSYAEALNDSVHHYFQSSVRNGIGTTLRTSQEIPSYVAEGKLVSIEENQYFHIDELTYSYPYLTGEAKELLEIIALRFRSKVSESQWPDAKICVTSMFRTANTLLKLRKKNRNATLQSAHLHGTSFDLSYAVFLSNKRISNKGLQHLKEVLAKTLYELRYIGRCWVTYERRQTCFHIVVR